MKTPYEQAAKIVEFEARLDGNGNIRLFPLDSDDGGGAYEYAGINSRYHPEALKNIVVLVNKKQHEVARKEATHYIAGYTQKTAELSSVPAMQFALRDTAFNRGPAGAVKTLQMALGVAVDGVAGPKTKAALKAAEANPSDFLSKFRAARERYEREVVGYRKKYWDGLVNRWDKQLKASLQALE